jgi:hypothetical protein
MGRNLSSAASSYSVGMDSTQLVEVVRTPGFAVVRMTRTANAAAAVAKQQDSIVAVAATGKLSAGAS